MPTLRSSLLAVVLLALAPLTAGAQVVVGTTCYFDHSLEDAADTARYELCVDAVTDASCSTVGVVKLGETTYKFTLPSTVPRGNRTLAVRAIGVLDTGASGASNVLAVRVVGRPGPPVLFRSVEAKP